jgi:hypothetical protein
MVAVLLVITFLAGYLTGFSVGERRWKRSAFEALDLASNAVANLRGDQSRRHQRRRSTGIVS